MGKWISSKEFAKSLSINKKSLEKACFRANQRGKKNCYIKSIIINFNYNYGIGGNAGKILQIWSEPLTPSQVEALEKGYPMKYVLEEMGGKCKEDFYALAAEYKGQEHKELGDRDYGEDLEYRDYGVDYKKPYSKKDSKNGVCVINENTIGNTNQASLATESTQPNIMESLDFRILGCKEGKSQSKVLGQNIHKKTLLARGLNPLNNSNDRIAKCCDCITNRNIVSTHKIESQVEITDLQSNVRQVTASCNDAIVKSKLDEVSNTKETDTNPNKENLTWHNLTPSQKKQAKYREKILCEYASAKSAGIKVAHFIELKNTEDSSLKLTEGKLFSWQRKYKEKGLSALSDKRGVAKLGNTSLPKWAQEEGIKLWRKMGSGYLNRMQLWRELHMIAPLYLDTEGSSKVCKDNAGIEKKNKKAKGKARALEREALMGANGGCKRGSGEVVFKGVESGEGIERVEYSYEKFLKAEISPLFSLNTLNRFLDSYFKANSLEYALITYGSDKTDSTKEPALGIQRELYTLPNQLWQMDSSPLDAIVLNSDGKQIRPSILSIIDVYSGRSLAYLSETSDSNAVVRLMWKAFESFGKPQAIQFDNGKDYLSNKVQGLLEGLNIKFVRSAAYKGKAKAIVERRFRTIQGSYITALTSYIGRNVSERVARESQTPKRERTSKDALGNPIKTQQKHIISFEAALRLLEQAVEFWNIDRVSRRFSKAKGKSPMDLWSEARFIKTKVDYAQFLLYANPPKVRIMGKSGIEAQPYCFIPTQYIEVGTKVLVATNINASNEAFIFNEKGEFLCIAYDRAAKPLTQEQLKTISKEYRGAIKRIRELQKDATHSEFIRMNARLEAESLKRKEKEALRKGVENTDSKVQKSLKAQVKEAIYNTQVEQHKEDNWGIDDWDILQKLAD